MNNITRRMPQFDALKRSVHNNIIPKSISQLRRRILFLLRENAAAVFIDEFNRFSHRV